MRVCEVIVRVSDYPLSDSSMCEGRRLGYEVAIVDHDRPTDDLPEVPPLRRCVVHHDLLKLYYCVLLSLGVGLGPGLGLGSTVRRGLHLTVNYTTELIKLCTLKEYK